jgi:DNA-directed RNA polymerase alpha subunit
MTPGKKQRTCKKGHRFFKSSECPTCPVCERERKPMDSFLALLSAPARRALEQQGISTLQQLTTWSEEELLKLHGFGPSSIPKLNESLNQTGLSFRK